ncbi:MAG: S16 family serine protease, partial [Saprospiraceae bacterium]
RNTVKCSLNYGGIKEKILAAKRAGLKEVLLCKDNEKHVQEIEKEYIQGLNFHYVDKMQDVLAFAIGLHVSPPAAKNGVHKAKKTKVVLAKS